MELTNHSMTESVLETPIQIIETMFPWEDEAILPLTPLAIFKYRILAPPVAITFTRNKASTQKENFRPEVGEIGKMKSTSPTAPVFVKNAPELLARTE